jgi:hypothetical protein
LQYTITDSGDGRPVTGVPAIDPVTGTELPPASTTAPERSSTAAMTEYDIGVNAAIDI